MTHPREDVTGCAAALELINEHGIEGIADAMKIVVNAAMRAERAAFLGAEAHERTDSRRGYANGFKPKTVSTRVGQIEFEVPQVRDVSDGDGFYPSALEKGLRSEQALKNAIAEMYVNGVSTRKVAIVTEKLCGTSISSMQVSRAAAALDTELEKWRHRSLKTCRYVVLDARYEKVRHGGSVVSSAVLVAIGIGEDGKRSVIGVSVSRSEAEVHWRAFLESLLLRGLIGVKLIVSDDHSGLKKALQAVFAGVKWQRCQCHLQRNATAYVPKIAMRAGVARDIRAIFNAVDKHEADRMLKRLSETYAESAPQLVEWAQENIPEGLTVFEMPENHRRRLRTSNMIERLNREIARRTKVATLFPNDASLLRLVSAVLAEVSDEWESGRCYLNMEAGTEE